MRPALRCAATVTCVSTRLAGDEECPATERVVSQEQQMNRQYFTSIQLKRVTTQGTESLTGRATRQKPTPKLKNVYAYATSKKTRSHMHTMHMRPQEKHALRPPIDADW